MRALSQALQTLVADISSYSSQLWMRNSSYQNAPRAKAILDDSMNEIQMPITEKSFSGDKIQSREQTTTWASNMDGRTVQMK